MKVLETKKQRVLFLIIMAMTSCGIYYMASYILNRYVPLDTLIGETRNSWAITLSVVSFIISIIAVVSKRVREFIFG